MFEDAGDTKHYLHHNLFSFEVLCSSGIGGEALLHISAARIWPSVTSKRPPGYGPANLGCRLPQDTRVQNASR